MSTSTTTTGTHGLTKSAYARQLGVTEGAVRLAIKNGKVTIKDNSRIDPDDPTNLAYADSLRVNLRAGKNRHIKSPAGATDQARELLEAKLAREQAQTKHRQLQTAILRGQYLHQDGVTAVLNKIYGVLQSEFINGAPVLAVDIAQNVFRSSDPTQVAAARSLLEARFWQILGSLQKAMIGFIEEQPITTDDEEHIND